MIGEILTLNQYKITKKSKQHAKLRHSAILCEPIEDPMKKVNVKVVGTRKQYLKWYFKASGKENATCT